MRNRLFSAAPLPLYSVLLAAGILLTPGLAGSYCLSDSCDDKTTDSPDSCVEIDGCLTGGLPLHWDGGCISFSVQSDASPLRGIRREDAEQAIGAGFAQWAAVDCGNGHPPSLRVYLMSPVQCSSVEFNRDQPNANVWMFRDQRWPYEDDGTLALTTVTYDRATGRIYDADVEVNSVDTDITVGDDNIQFDLRSIATHEAGHVLGLAHSQRATASMYAEYSPATIRLRALDVDDERGICASSPPHLASAGSCDPTPINGFSPLCAVDTARCGVSAIGSRSPSPPWLPSPAWGGILLIVCGTVRRHRRSPRANAE